FPPQRGAPSRTRTDTGRILSPLPLPIGLWGPGGECSARNPIRDTLSHSNFGSLLNVRRNCTSRRIRAPRLFFLFCRLGRGDTAMSLDRSLLKLVASALRSRK